MTHRERLHTTTCIKHASLRGRLSPIKSLFTNPNKGGLFGEAMKDLARTKGVTYDPLNALTDPRFLTSIGNDKLKERVVKTLAMLNPGKGRADKGVIIDTFRNAHLGKKNRLGTSRKALAVVPDLEDKVNQSQLFEALGLGHLMPKTIRLADMLDEHPKARSLETLSKKVLGTPDVILRTGGGVGTTLGSSSKEVARINTILRRAKKNPSVLDDLIDDLDIDDIVISPKSQMASISGVRKAFNRLPGVRTYFDRLYKGDMPDIKEYRVHVVNGKVVPYASLPKWDMLGLYGVPGRGRDVRRVEEAVQQFMDTAQGSKNKSVSQYRLGEHVLGFDVGLDKKGRPKIFEINPTGAGGTFNVASSENFGSGLSLHPWVGNAMSSAVKGTTPLAQRLRQTGVVGAVTGGAAGTGYGLHAALKPPPTPVDHLKELHKKFTPF